MRLRWCAGLSAATGALAVIAGCGGTLTGASADGGGPPDATTGRANPTAGAQGGLDAGGALEDAAKGFLPGDGSTSVPGTSAENCPDEGSTSISGTVYDPAGVNPLVNAVVYVPTDPQAPLPPLTMGTGSVSDSCNPVVD